MKNNNTILETYKIIISTFSLSNKNDRERFFDKSFLLTNVNLDILLKILFLIMSNTDVNFLA